MELNDPFQLVVDLQLQSVSGLIETELSRHGVRGKSRESGTRTHAQTMTVRKTQDTYRRRENLENALIWAYDLKYHRNGGLLDGKVEEMFRIGYTERQISSLLGVGKGTVWRVKKRLKIKRGLPGKRTRGIQHG
ncbi:MAG: hypothetical protein HY788_21345 [Deltaproteobacteria bacterium]|nr:hypothetical protein [Deltaproteobacteria bacterium]